MGSIMGFIMVYLCLFTQADDRSSHWSVTDWVRFLVRPSERWAVQEQLQEEFPKHLIVINGLSWSIMVYWIYPGLSISINHPVYHLIDPHVMGLSWFFNVCQGWTQHGRRAGGTVLLNWASIPGKKWTFPPMHLDMYKYMYIYIYS